MNIKTGIKVTFTILMIFLYIGFCFLQIIPSFKDAFNEKSEKVINLIENNLDKPGNYKRIGQVLAPDEYITVWLKKGNHTWQPVIYNRKFISSNEMINPRSIPKSIKHFTVIYPNKNKPAISHNNNRYFFWLNLYYIPTWIIKVLIPTLIFLIPYIFLLILIELFFGSRKSPELITEKNNDKRQQEIFEEDIIENDILEDEIPENEIPDDEAPTFKYEQDDSSSISGTLNKNDLLESYEDLWKNNFKISENFKSNFPFEKIYNLVKLGITPEKYIKDSLEFASGYFKWKNPKFFIKQQHVYVEINTKDILDESGMYIPDNGNKKGAFYIPLFPYKINNIYGYFYFEWNDENKFEIADIVYFLKFLFSDRAKDIFLNYDKLNKIIDKLKTKLNQNKNISLALLEIGDKKNLESNLKPEWIDDLTVKINERLKNHFKTDEITTFSPYLFGIIGEDQDKEKQILKLERWINDLELQLYPVSKEYGSIALTYSGGVSFLDNRNIHPVSLLNEAENNLQKAISKGRNQVVYK